MNTDRRILAWLALLVSLVCFAPLACGTGFLAFAGGVSYFDPEGYWDRSDTVLFGGIFVVMILILVVGFLLGGWGVATLLKRDAGSSTKQEEIDPDQDVIG